MGRLHRFLVAHRAADPVLISLLFLVAVWFQWSGSGSVVVADAQAYAVGGVSLIRHGAFVNAFGAPELWFPPLFPVLIGLASLGGRLDPFVAGRLIAVLCSVVTVVLVWRLTYAATGTRAAAAAAALVLACNSMYQHLAAQCLSQPLATLLATTALAVWLRFRNTPRHRDAVLFGVLVGAGYLVRPEVILLLTPLALIDLLLGPRRFEGLRKTAIAYGIAGIVCLMCAAPYVAYLHAHTGRMTLSNKDSVNLAGGRAEYYHWPREYIDTKTLDMGFPNYPLDRLSEIGRYDANIGKIGWSYADIFRLPVGFAIPMAAVAGFAMLWRAGQRRLAWGLLAPCAYLAVLARYAVNPSYLHATLPSIALVAGVALSSAMQLARQRRGLMRVGATLFLVCALVGVAEQGTRQSRWALTQKDPDALLKEAGIRLRARTDATGTVIALGATVSYYSGLKRARLTPNDLHTIRAYYTATSPRQEPIYLAVATLDGGVDSSIASLLHDSGSLPKILDLSDGDNRVAIFRLQ